MRKFVTFLKKNLKTNMPKKIFKLGIIVVMQVNIPLYLLHMENIIESTVYLEDILIVFHNGSNNDHFIIK